MNMTLTIHQANYVADQMIDLLTRDFTLDVRDMRRLNSEVGWKLEPDTAPVELDIPTLLHCYDLTHLYRGNR